MDMIGPFHSGGSRVFTSKFELTQIHRSNWFKHTRTQGSLGQSTAIISDMDVTDAPNSVETR